jgi:hypothetical protein
MNRSGQANAIMVGRDPHSRPRPRRRIATFSDPVVVTAREYVQQVFVLIGEVGADLVGSGSELPEQLRPALGLVRRVADGTARRGMELRRTGT